LIVYLRACLSIINREKEEMKMKKLRVFLIVLALVYGDAGASSMEDFSEEQRKEVVDAYPSDVQERMRQHWIDYETKKIFSNQNVLIGMFSLSRWHEIPDGSLYIYLIMANQGKCERIISSTDKELYNRALITIDIVKKWFSSETQ
jgi:hypothetical protein